MLHYNALQQYQKNILSISKTPYNIWIEWRETTLKSINKFMQDFCFYKLNFFATDYI